MSQENVEVVRQMWDFFVEHEGDPAAGFNAAFDQGLLASSAAAQRSGSEASRSLSREASRSLSRVGPNGESARALDG